MGRASLSEAIALLKSTDVNFRNMSTIVGQLVQEGFDQETAKKAVRLAVRDGSEIQGLMKSAITIDEAFKALIKAVPSATPSQVYDGLIHQGIDPQHVDEAMDSVDLDSPDIEVEDHEDDEIYHGDQHNVNGIEDLDPEILTDLERFLERSGPGLSHSEVQHFLDIHGVPGNTTRAIVRTLFSKTSAVDVTADQLADILKHFKVDPKEAFSHLTETAGFSPEEAKRAIHISYGDEEAGHDRPEAPPSPNMGEGPMEEDPEMGDPSMGDLMGDGGGGMSTGMDETGMAVGDPGLTDMTGMGGMNDLEDSATTDQDVRPGETNWHEVAQGYMDSVQTPDEMHQILRGLGASEQEARQVAHRLDYEGDSEVIRPGASVEYKGETLKVASVSSSLYGDMYVFNNGQTAFVNDPEVTVVNVKEASSEDGFDGLINKVAEFYNIEYIYDTDSLTKMAKTAESLVEELNSYSTEKMSEQLAIREKVAGLTSAERLFREAAFNRSLEVEEYKDSQPKYKVAHQVVEGYEFGPGGGDVIAITAAELKEEQDSIDWDNVINSEAAVFVDDNPHHLGSTGDMRKAASRFINAKVSHLEGEEQDRVRQAFLAKVEKGRRIALRELSQAKEARATETEIGHDYDEGVYL